MTEIKNRKIKKIALLLAIMFAVASAFFVFTGCDFFYDLFFERDDNGTQAEDPNYDFDDGMRMYFLDVGQADAVFVRFATGETMLIDAGRWNLTQNDFRARIREFFPSGQRMKFDWFITTHSHADHIGSAYYIVNNSYIRNIVRPVTFTQGEVNSGAYRDFGVSAGQARVHNTVNFQNFVTAMNNTATWTYGRDTNITIPYAGKYFYIGGARVTFYSPTNYNYYPGNMAAGTNVNQHSTIFCVYFNGKRVLFTGDAYQVNERRVLNNLPTDVNILDVGHHGSNTSTAQDFLNHIRPAYAIIQVGAYQLFDEDGNRINRGNSYGHPHQVVLNRLASVYTTVKRTDQLGDILIRVCPEGEHKRVGALVPAAA